MKPFIESDRRAFITGTCVAGIGAAFVTKTEANQSRAEECKGSIADALLLFDEILLEVQSDAVERAAQAPFKAARDCADALESLTKLVDELKKEICKPVTGGSARRMEDLVEAGSSNAKLLKASVSSASEKEIGLMVSAIGTITRRIQEAAKEVEMECTLTPDGKTKLLKIFAEVEKAKPIAEAVRFAQEVWAKKVAEILCQVKAVQHNMFAAAIAITERDIPRLDKHVEAAICFLKKLDDSAKDPGLMQPRAGTGNLQTPTASPSPTPSPTPKPAKVTSKPTASTMTHEPPECDAFLNCEPHYNPKPPGKPAEVLIGLLRGAQAVAKNPAAGSFEVSRNFSDYDQSSFVATADPRLVTFPAPPHVGDLLEAYCKPYTYVRRAVLTSAVGCARAAHPAGAERLRDIKWIVYKMKCNEPSNREELAKQLAA